MHTLEPELRRLHAEGVIDDGTAARALARERREVLSVHYEVRGVLYVGVALVMAGVGVFLARNLDRIGPLTIVLALAVAAAICLVPALRAKRAGRAVSTAGEYLLLLGALLISADLGYAERQFTLLGPYWSSHLLLLAVVHALLAYTFRSRLVLAAALTALAGWFGIETVGDMLPSPESGPAFGLRALSCAATVALWRHFDCRGDSETTFSPVFEHFVLNLTAWGLIAWCDFLWIAGLPLLAMYAYLTVRRGLDTGREVLLVYGTVYPAIGLGTVVTDWWGGTAEAIAMLLIVGIAATCLWQLRRRLRDAEP